MSRRRRLVRLTLLAASLPVVAGGIWIAARRGAKQTPYVPGKPIEGITRDLDRDTNAFDPGIRFTEVTEEAGVRFAHFPFTRTSQLPEDMGSGVAWGDYDGDGDYDLFLVNFAAPLGISDEEMAASAATDRLFRNRGDGTFEDATDEAGVGRAHRGMGAAWGDYDADGDLDLVVTAYGENLLWENRGDGTFRDVTARAGLGGAGFWAGASWCDFDLDGDLDLYICGYVQYVAEPPASARTRAANAEFPYTLNPSSYEPHPNRCYVNRGDGTFAERAEALGLVNEQGRSLAAAWADFDADGRPDLYVANDVSDNALFLNRGSGGFDDVSYEAAVADYRGAMGLAIGDWDNDLDQDIFVTHWIAQENALYSSRLSDDGATERPAALSYVDEADRVGLGQIALDLIGWGTGFADLDQDGWQDLFVANGSTFQDRKDPTRLLPMHPHLYRNHGRSRGFFEIGAEAGIRTAAPGVARGSAFADYDGDGDLDLLVVHHGGRARLFRNDTAGGHWIVLRLRGRSGHPSARNARAIATAGGRSYLREAGAQPSYLSQNADEIHFGLGDAEVVDSLEVWWPRGARSVWRALAADRVWLLVEGADPLEVAAATSSAGAQREAERRTSDMSRHAVVADMSTTLSRDEQMRFWSLKKEAADLFGAGEWEGAARVYEEMSALDPRHEDALYNRGNALLEMKRYDEARLSWERLIEVNPSATRAWVQIGVLHTMPEAGPLFDLKRASDAFGRAVELNPEQSGPVMLGGAVALARGELDRAEDLLVSAYRMNSQASLAIYLAGYVAWKRGERDVARARLDAAVASLRAQAPAHGVAGEGDTRSHRMEAMRRDASRRYPFAACIDGLGSAPATEEIDRAYERVDRERERLGSPPG